MKIIENGVEVTLGPTVIGGTIDNTVIGGTTPAAGTFTTLTATGAINTAYATVASHATTSAIWAAAGNVINFTGNEVITAFPAAAQAGSQRILLCAGTPTFTSAGAITVQGGTYLASAGDEIVVTATTTTAFKVSIKKQDANPVKLDSPPAMGETAPNTIRGKNKEIFVTASGSLIAAQCSGTIISNYGMTDADCIIDLPTAAVGLAFLCVLPAVRARYFRLRCPSARSDKIYLDGIAGADDGYVGVASGYTTLAAISMVAVKASDGNYDWFATTITGGWIAG
jgi:hypothetical protein